MSRLNARWRAVRRLTVVFSLMAVVLLPAAITQAANGSLYMTQATDPHGELWLSGALGGHLWLADVLHGFCRMDVDASTGGVSISAATNACAHTGQKSSQPTLDPTVNADGTQYVYSCDWATGSVGCYRMTYVSATETMVKTELLAPGRFPSNIKPFATALGPRDHKLYVSSDLVPDIYRYTLPNDPTVGNQQVEHVGVSSDGKRIRAITFACWDPLRVQQGLPSCSQMAAAGDVAPDLVIAQITSIDVILNAETCQSAPGGCPVVRTPVLVISPMGLFTQPGNPDLLYVTDSPATTSQIIRYTISTNTQDSYSNFGPLPDGTLAQYSFMFSITMGPDGAIYGGDDPSAGASGFNGRIWRLAPGLPADAVGSPGRPASPPVLPALKTSMQSGNGVSLPNDGVWMGNHLWMADGVSGFCRMDSNPLTGQVALNLGTCSTPFKPGQPAFDVTTNFVYVPDASSKSVGVVRLQFDPNGTICGAPESVCNPVQLAPGQGLEGQKADAAALDPTSGALYVGFLARKTTVPTQIARVNNPAGPLTSQSVEFVATTTRLRPVYGLGFVGPDLWIGDNGGLEWLPNVKTCTPGGCATVLILNMAGPRGFATDGKQFLYLAAPLIPPPGSNPLPGSIHTVVQRYDITTGSLFAFSSTAILPDGSTGQYDIVDSLTLDPAGNLLIADDPNVLGLPVGQGRVFQIGSGPQSATVSITSKPGTPTKNASPSFSFASALAGAVFQCSLVPSAAADAFSACTSPASYGPLTDGTYDFKVTATDASGSTSAAAAWIFTVDSVAPVVTMGAAPVSPTNVNTPTFSFSATKPVNFQCSLTTAGAIFAPCLGATQTTASTITYAAQPDGAYTFSVQAVDAAGNVSAPVTTAVTIDTIPPTITANPPAGQYATTQTVTLTSSEPATIRYTLDGSQPTANSPVYLAPLAGIGANTTLGYVGVDLAGNVSPVVSSVYTISSVSIDGAPVSPTNVNQPRFVFSASTPGATFKCSLSSGTLALAPCASPLTYPAQADGTYTFTVQGFDPSGVSLGTVSTRLVVDTVAPPAPILTQNPGNPTGNSAATFAFASEPGASFMCSLVPSTSAVAYAPCTSPTTRGPLADGTYTFQVTASDAAGNTSAPDTYTFMVQAAGPPLALAPSANLAVGSTATTGVIPVVLTWSASACTSGVPGCNVASYNVQESVNGGAWANVILSSSTSTSVVRGLRPSPVNQSTVTTYQYQVQATSTTGQVGAFSVGPTFSVASQDDATSISYTGSWSGQNISGAFNGAVHWSTTSGATAGPSTPFSGTTVAWVSTMGPDRGIAQVKLDGQVVVTVDLYAATQKTAQVVWSASNLSPGTHTVQVVAQGTRNAASTSSRVDLDALVFLK